MNNYHTSALLQETIQGLKVKPNERYIDATLGGGGHSFEILKRGGLVLGIDVDKDALEFVGGRWKIENARFAARRGKWKIAEKNLTLVRGNFREIDKIALLNNFNNISGIIFDLGVSSHQIDSSERGFSFQNQGPLDMRMDQELGVKALDLIKILTKGELYEIFTKYGEESSAWAISENIVKSRSIKPIETTIELARVIEIGLKSKGLNNSFTRAGQSKKVFQALRIAVNDELNSIGEALPKAVGQLCKQGRLCVISFHSLEDRIVKKAFIEFENKKMGKIITEKPIIPGTQELIDNPRVRSAKLRIFEKL